VPSDSSPAAAAAVLEQDRKDFQEVYESGAMDVE